MTDATAPAGSHRAPGREPAREPARLPGDAQPLPPATVDRLTDDLVDAFGAAAVRRDRAGRLSASADWAHMSPVLAPLLPGGVADVVVFPRDASGIALAVALAHRHRVPVTPRGQGTGNYGQGIPLYGGMVLDTSRATTIHRVTDGAVSADAGASFVALEKAARATGQELAILPSTVGSTLGGFIAGGSGGTGSLANGAIWTGYLHELRVAACTDEPSLHAVPYPQNTAMAHAFGVSGVIAGATVALRPAVPWTALFAAFDTLERAAAAGEALFELAPTPRLVSLDEPGITETYRPADPAMPPGAVSLRAIVSVGSVEAAGRIVAGHGGTVTDVRANGPALLASLSYNHVTHRVRKLRPELTHLQCMGRGLVHRRAEVAATVPDSLVHLEGFDIGGSRTWVGMLFTRFVDTPSLYAGMDALAHVEVDVDDPHTWVLHHDRLGQVRAAARRFDPDGLLNPGKLPPA
ncbi:FAD-binding protein [Dactylosporangium sp. AC04546]|uniref:FAD-binding oxidoreductase n=1 Tax=Dactylosporangium sp. AC04546 TaxID=2862460 RepID=UPI001EDC9EA6|nr:FAD-binding protein [Dactylosporangium sp. AC04546]WVK79329.1 FAD-binding protein [Dactylosporangium sp. AC04546]